MRLLFAAGLVVGCHRITDEPVETPAPEVRPAIEPAPTPTPAPKPTGKTVKLARRDSKTLCMTDAGNVTHCRELAFDRFDPRTKSVSIKTDSAKPGHETKLSRDGAACTERDNQLTCGATSTPVTSFYGGYYVYLHEPDAVSWYDPSLADKYGVYQLHAMPRIPDGIAQLAIGFRIGCARTTKAEVYCWSDPEKPARKVATPANVVDLALQDPFELCVRTAGGEVHCTAPYTQPEEMFCDKHSIACGTGEIEKVKLKTSFDPLTKVMRPLRRVTLPHTALEVDADDAPIYQFCLDSLYVGHGEGGTCALGDGKVTCLSACGGSWGAKPVGGLPSTIRRVWSDAATAYALADDGALYWWSRKTDCDAKAPTTAMRFAALPAIADLADPLSLQSGPQSHEPVRCALTELGEVRCWQTERLTGTPAMPFDPTR